MYQEGGMWRLVTHSTTIPLYRNGKRYERGRGGDLSKRVLALSSWAAKRSPHFGVESPASSWMEFMHEC